jgi:hypothetical protein
MEPPHTQDKDAAKYRAPFNTAGTPYYDETLFLETLS